MSEFEALADAITGGVVGRAVEPSAGEGPGHTHEASCLNCGTPLIGLHCHECGQHAHVHRTLSAFFHDFAHGVLHFEGKIWRTIPLLVWKPGELTRRYIDGQRASFVSPIALFLFSVFLMFGVLSATGNLKPHLAPTRDLVAAQKQAEQTIAKLEQARSHPGLDAHAVRQLDKQIASEEDDLSVIQDLRGRGVTEGTFTRSKSDFSSDLPWLEDAYHKAKQNPDLLLYKIKSDSYKWSWGIIPLSVPFVWLLFPFSRRFRTYDHTVFVTYSVSFMTLLTTVGVLLSAAGTTLGGVLFLVPPVHIYRQLRGTYGIGRWAAAWRTGALLVVALLVLVAFALLMLALGISD